MTREPLPNRRYSESFEIRHLGINYAVQVGCYRDGRVGEVFLGMERAAGSFADVAARDTAVMISMALQHGVPVDRMRAAITKDQDGKSEGLAGVVLEMLETWQAKRDGWVA